MLIFKKVPEKRPYSSVQDDVEIEMKMSSENTWPDVVQNLLDFLRSCGYVIPYGEFEIIEEEQKEPETEPDFDLEEVEEEEGTVEIPVPQGCAINYCSNCSCGKKEKALGLEEETL